VTTLGIALMPGPPASRYAALARRCEELDFSRIWVPDERFWQAMSVLLTQVALATDRVELGSAVTDPYIRHPALTAQMMATLDELSGGRVVVGLGAGISGFDALGIERKRPIRALREATELMRRLWTGEAVDYRGEMFRFHGAHLDFEPPRADIPVVIAGRGPQVLGLAGRIADGVMIGSLSSPSTLSYALGRIDGGLEKAGRGRSEIEISMWLHTAISEDREAAEEAVRPIVTGALISSRDVLDTLGVEVPEELANGLENVTYGLNSPAMARVQSMVDASIIEHFALAATPEGCGERAQQLQAAGVDHIAIVPWLVEGQSLEEFVDRAADALGSGLRRDE